MSILARDIMTGGAECIGVNETLEQAARKMKDLDVGSLPICGDDNRLKGMLTDRDIVVRCLADGGDLIGMLSQADIARNYPEDRVGELVEFISY